MEAKRAGVLLFEFWKGRARDSDLVGCFGLVLFFGTQSFTGSIELGEYLQTGCGHARLKTSAEDRDLISESLYASVDLLGRVGGGVAGDLDTGLFELPLAELPGGALLFGLLDAGDGEDLQGIAK